MDILYGGKRYRVQEIYHVSHAVKEQVANGEGIVGIVTDHPAFYLAAVLGIAQAGRQAYELKDTDGEYWNQEVISKKKITAIVTDKADLHEGGISRQGIQFGADIWKAEAAENQMEDYKVSFVTEQPDVLEEVSVITEEDVERWSGFVKNILKRDMTHVVYMHGKQELWNPYVLLEALKENQSIEIVEAESDAGMILKQLKELAYSSLCLSLSQFYQLKYAMIIEEDLKKAIHDVITYGNEVYDLNSIKEHFNHKGIRWHNFMGNGALQMVSAIRKEDDGSLYHLAKEIKGLRTGIMNRSQKDMPVGIPEALYVCRERNEKTEFVGKRLADGKIVITGWMQGYCYDGGRLCSLRFIEQQVKQSLPVTKLKIQYENQKIIIFFSSEKEITEHDVEQFVKTKVPSFYPELEWNYEEEDVITQTTFQNLLKRRRIPGMLKKNVLEKIELTGQQKEIAQVWKNILKLPEISIDDNFFDIGGNSALFVQMLAQVTDITQKEVSMMKLMEQATLRNYFKFLEEDGAAEAISLHDIVEQDIKAEPYLENLKEAEEGSGEVKTVFLTGANGFLGCFLLKELLTQTDAAVYCLIREKDEKHAYQKLFDAMCYYKLDVYMDAKRIIPLCGDLGKEHFGIPAQVYETLCEKVDVIVHSGAVVNFVYNYEMLKNENVIGTGRILEFASTKKVKPVQFISSMAIFGVGKKSSAVDEDFPLDVNDLPRSGYNQTKWAADALVGNARKLGLPCNIYRVGNVCGDSVNGVCQTRDFIWMLFKVGIEMKKFPEYYRLPFAMSTVDSMARSVIQLALAENKKAGDNYHIMSGVTVIYQQLLEWVKTYGFDFSISGFQEWVELVRKYTRKLSAKFQSIPSVIGVQEDVADDFAFIQYDNTKTLNAVEQLGGKILPLSEEVFHKHLEHFEEINFIHAKK